MSESIRKMGHTFVPGAVFLIASIMAGLLSGGTARALDEPLQTDYDLSKTGEFLLQADEIIYDRDIQTITAQGNVEIVYDTRILMAERLTYNEKTGALTAYGKISILESNGDVIFADHVEMADRMKEGFISGLSMLMADDTRLAAVSANRRRGNVTTFRKGVFSPCETCQETGSTTPLWQIKAYEIIHNQEEQRIIYKDAFFEFFGFPVGYLPFFYHPDPTVERQSGFLFPRFGSSGFLGTKLSIPYYWSIAPHMDATFTPTYTSKRGILYQGEFRHLTQKGRYQINLAATKPDTRDAKAPTGSDYRSSLFANGHFSVSDQWKWGFTVETTSDDTFLRRYDILGATELTNNVFAESRDGRNIFRADAYYFQGLLSTDISSQAPVILPLLYYHYEPSGKFLGGRSAVDLNFLSLQRPRGTDTTRLSASFNWDSSVLLRTGKIIQPFAQLRTDAYLTNNVSRSSGSPTSHQLRARVLPTLGVEMRWPWLRNGNTTRQIIEPVIQLVYAPNGGNSGEIPNEDSAGFEFDDTNLFSENRFPGLDRWEGGARSNIGMNFSVYGENGGQLSMLLGQTFRLRENNAFGTSSGLGDQQSDYVGRIHFAPSGNFDITHRFRLDQKNFSSRRNEVDVRADWWRTSSYINYAFFDKSLSSKFGTREEVSGGLKLKLDEFWSFAGSVRYDLERQKRQQSDISFNYLDECFGISIGYRQKFFRDRDIAPDDTFLVQFHFKHLGQNIFSAFRRNEQDLSLNEGNAPLD